MLFRSIPAEAAFLRALRELTRRHNLLLIVDEIQTGVGRTGTLWGYEDADVAPDIMTLGKMLGGGVPLAALVATDAASCFAHGDQGGTYNGNPLMAKVGCAVLDAVLAPGFLEGVRERGAYLEGRLRELSARRGLGEVRGRGMLLALETGAAIATDVAERARVAGLLVNAPRPSVLRFMPALTVSEAEIDTALAILERAVGDAQEAATVS